MVDRISHESDSPIQAPIGHSFPRRIRSSNRISDQAFASTCLGKQGDIEVAENKLKLQAKIEQIDDVAGKIAGKCHENDDVAGK